MTKYAAATPAEMSITFAAVRALASVMRAETRASLTPRPGARRNAEV